MTTWVNMFEAGACKVEVWDTTGQVFIDTMAKGDTSASFNANNGSTHCIVNVDSSGAVKLSITPDGSLDGLSLFVDPQYDTTSLATRIVGIDSSFEGDGTVPYGGEATADCDDRSQDATVSLDTSPATPPEVDFTAHAAGDDGAFVGLFTNGSTTGGSAASLQFTPEVEASAPSFTCDETIIEVWQPPAEAYNLRIRAYSQATAFAADADVTMVDSRLVFLLALANMKAHYGQPDASAIANQVQLRLRKMKARNHNNRLYRPQPQWTPPPRPIIANPDD